MFLHVNGRVAAAWQAEFRATQSHICLWSQKPWNSSSQKQNHWSARGDYNSWWRKSSEKHPVHAGKYPWRDTDELNINGMQHRRSEVIFFPLLITSAGMLSPPETHMTTHTALLLARRVCGGHLQVRKWTRCGTQRAAAAFQLGKAWSALSWQHRRERKKCVCGWGEVAYPSSMFGWKITPRMSHSGTDSVVFAEVKQFLENIVCRDQRIDT